jgi:hypothetical protein
VDGLSRLVRRLGQELCPVFFRLQPAAAEGLIEVHHRLQASEPDLRELIAGTEQCLLGLWRRRAGYCWIARRACASLTRAAATATSRLSACARAIRSDSSGLSKSVHHRGCGHTWSGGIVCPLNAVGTIYDVRT